ncbi:MAG: Rieske (2Fe-2S) protein [Fuerstiella sp.]
MSDKETSDVSAPVDKHENHPSTRRNILVEGLTAILSFLLVAVPSTLGGIYFLDPILRRNKAGSAGGGELEGFIKLAITSDSVPEDGTPVAVTVQSDLDDAWNRFKDVPVGSIWLRKNPDGRILVFNSVCPHLGCSVDYRRNEGDFFCPCHTSSFDLDGQKTNEVPPRAMDTLELLTATNGAVSEGGQELWVKYQNFRRATAEKIVI